MFTKQGHIAKQIVRAWPKVTVGLVVIPAEHNNLAKMTQKRL